MSSRDQQASGPTAVATRERYERLELLGRGGMGEVWRAWDHELDMPVALKSLRPQVARDPKVLARFRREARIARRIKHVNVAQMHDLIEIAGIRYLSMEHVDGKTLRAILEAKRSLPVHVALDLMRQICSGVQAAHEIGVVHRDLKPHNIMVTRKHGRISILDFGIARAAEEDDMTEVGVILGSPQYLSYEQLSGEDATPRSDVYQLGILLYEFITGVSPFRAPGQGMATLRAMREVPPDPRQIVPRLPGFVADAVLRCLSKFPEDRFPSARALWEHLEAHRAEQAPQAGAEPLDLGPDAIALGSAPTALVAVSSPQERAVIADRLGRLGCIVTEQGDGAGAVDAAWSTAFSIVVMAASLPGLDGLTACQILRRSPTCAQAPIIVLVEPHDGRDAFAREAGASAVLQSPLNVHAFAKSVRELLG